MIIRRARPRSYVMRDHDPPSSETTIVDIILTYTFWDNCILRTCRVHYFLYDLGNLHFAHLSCPLFLMRSHPCSEHVPRASFFSAFAFLRAATASGFW